MQVIYWKPQFRWHIDKIHILAPVRIEQAGPQLTESKEKKGSFIESNRGRRIKAEPRFFRAQLDNGVLDAHACLANSHPDPS